MILNIFSCAYWPSVCLLCRNPYLDFCLFFDWVLFFSYWAAWAVCIFCRLIPCQLHCFQIFPPILNIIFSFSLWSSKGWKGLPCGSADKESTCNVGDLGSIPGLGKSPAKGKGYPLQYSGLENSMDCIVNGVARVGHDWVTFTSRFRVNNLLSLISSHLFSFVYFPYSRRWIKNDIAVIYVRRVFCLFSCKNFIVSSHLAL